MPFLVRMVADAIAILPIGYLLPQVVSADGVPAALAAAFVPGLVNAAVPGFHVNGFFGAVAGPVPLPAVSWVLTRVAA